jgi:hypothetical protein
MNIACPMIAQVHRQCPSVIEGLAIKQNELSRQLNASLNDFLREIHRANQFGYGGESIRIHILPPYMTHASMPSIMESAFAHYDRQFCRNLLLRSVGLALALSLRLCRIG